MNMDGKKRSSLKGVVSKKPRPARIHKALSAAAPTPASNHPPTRSAGSDLFSPQAWEEIARSLRLSDWELQIVRRVFDGEKELSIAAALNVSAHTVHTHVERLHHKLAISDRAQMLTRVRREFLALTVAPGNVLPPIYADRATGRCSLGCQP